MYIIFGLVLGFLIFIVPVILTILNILFICSNKEGSLYDKRQKYTRITLTYGTLLYFAEVACISGYTWDEPIVHGAASFEFHQPFSEDYLFILVFIEVISVISLLLLDRSKIMPPLSAALCVCGTYAGFILLIFSGIQFLGLSTDKYSYPAFVLIYLWIYILNYFLCAVRVLREVIGKYCSFFRESDMTSRSKISCYIAKKLSTVSGCILFPLICLIPFTGLIICITIICGQGPDAIIKAFTETSDWTFSRMISPPPIQYEGHYLCTVAVNGHEKIVKPTRLGIRHGTKIVVNRQLCTANAFEQLIEDKAPRFHKLVRYIYDKYGYPISKHITTKFRADVIYIIMKPLEWVFLITLYLFDVDPESRIALQYTGRHVNEFKTLKNLIK